MAADRSDDYFCAHVAGLIHTVKERDYPVFTAFLDLHQQALARQICAKEAFSAYRLEGLFPDAERQVLGLAPSYLEPAELEFPVAVLEVTWPGRYSLTHRDFLGSLMALGIKRDVLGDLMVGEGQAQAVVLEHLAEMICRDVSKIGRVGVEIRQIPALTMDPQKRFQLLEGTVASLRLDAVASLALRQSRGKTAELIREGCIAVNGAISQSASQLLKPGDRLSVRGFGKFQLAQEIGTTRKERLHVVIRKYI